MRILKCPLCNRTTCKEVGSPIMTCLGIGTGNPFSRTCFAPNEPSSSSQRSNTARQPCFTFALSIAWIAIATKPFMSQEPRAYQLPPRSVNSHGSFVQLPGAGTVSMWPHSVNPSSEGSPFVSNKSNFPSSCEPSLWQQTSLPSK